MFELLLCSYCGVLYCDIVQDNVFNYGVFVLSNNVLCYFNFVKYFILNYSEKCGSLFWFITIACLKELVNAQSVKLQSA
jgi:hypothetical protein